MSDPPDQHSDFLSDDDAEFDIEKFSEEFDENLALHVTEEGDLEIDEAKDSSSPAEEEFFGVNPSNILEGMLFVGNTENRPLTADEMSELMRGVGNEEIDELVADLNESYRASQSPFEIILEKDGYRLVLTKEFEFCRKRFYREEKAATLSQSVVDVLSLVAYLQPVTKKEVEAKRLKPSGSILGQLVRRRLIQIERNKVDGKRTQTFYRTTERFLELFGLAALEELPKTQSFDLSELESPQ